MKSIFSYKGKPNLKLKQMIQSIFIVIPHPNSHQYAEMIFSVLSFIIT